MLFRALAFVGGRRKRGGGRCRGRGRSRPAAVWHYFADALSTYSRATSRPSARARDPPCLAASLSWGRGAKGFFLFFYPLARRDAPGMEPAPRTPSLEARASSSGARSFRSPAGAEHRCICATLSRAAEAGWEVARRETRDGASRALGGCRRLGGACSWHTARPIAGRARRTGVGRGQASRAAPRFKERARGGASWPPGRNSEKETRATQDTDGLDRERARGGRGAMGRGPREGGSERGRALARNATRDPRRGHAAGAAGV